MTASNTPSVQTTPILLDQRSLALLPWFTFIAKAEYEWLRYGGLAR